MGPLAPFHSIRITRHRPAVTAALHTSARRELLPDNEPPPVLHVSQAGINHFLDCVTAAAEPRVTATDALRAAAVMAAARESLRTGAPAAVDYSLTSAAAAAAAGEAPLAGATATVRLAASAKQLAAGAGAAAAAAARKDDEGGVSTPPHQGTPAAKAGPGTPESPPLLPLPHRA